MGVLGTWVGVGISGPCCGVGAVGFGVGAVGFGVPVGVSVPPPPPPSPPAVTALLFKMEEANLASRAKAQELLHATNQVGLPHSDPRPIATPAP